jgi:DNA-directed RNA polymerase specialized sigma24 family protein
MDRDGSVTGWIQGLKSGDQEAARRLWERYFRRMVAVARQRLHGAPAAFDEEVVALSAFDLVSRAIRDGRFTDLNNRQILWRLLAVSTTRKASDRLKVEGAAKRGGGRSTKEGQKRLPREDVDLDELASSIADPQFTALMADECLRLLMLLEDEDLQQAAQWRLEGYTNDEIAEKMGFSRRTVQRMLAVIRAVWSREIGQEDEPSHPKPV